MEPVFKNFQPAYICDRNNPSRKDVQKGGTPEKSWQH